jgi:tRNA-dihydrouridine synthase B
MAAAASVVESLGADIIDVNMGCPVPKIARHHAGCSLMREPGHAQEVIAAMTRAVKIPVTVKMRAGWDDSNRNAPTVAKMAEDAGAAAVAVHGRTAAQSYAGLADWELVGEIAGRLTIPVFGSGDCLEPGDVVQRLNGGADGVLVGRGVLRNPWILIQSADLAAGRPVRTVTMEERGRFLLDYVDLLVADGLGEPEGFRHVAARPGSPHGASTAAEGRSRASRERWVVNKVRALGSWYTKCLENGSRLRSSINSAESIDELRDLIAAFFGSSCGAGAESGAHRAVPGRETAVGF